MDDKSLSISFPEKFNLSENIDNSLDAINSIRKITSQSKNHLKRIDLNPIREISTSASLLLTAEIDKWNNKVGNRLTPRTKEWSPSVRKHLIDLGFFELCNFNYDEFKESENNNTLEIVKFIKGSNKDVNKAKFLRQEIERIVRGRVKRPSLFQALSEAITNVTHHAYPTKSQLEKNWYMTASFCDESRNLKVAFYDQGIGIPSSLPKSNLWERAKHFLSKSKLYNDHPSLIEAAVEMGRSKEDKSYRGKGLQDLLEFIKQYGNGYLSILSQKGLYKFSSNNRNESSKKEKLNTPILGTLIIWCVKVPERGSKHEI